MLRSWSSAYDLLNSITSFVYDPHVVTLLPPYTDVVLDDQFKTLLSSLYEELYPDKVFHHISSFIQRYGRVIIYGDIIGSVVPGQNNRKSSIIMAHWPSRGASITSTDCSRPSVGEVQYFFKHSITVRTEEGLLCLKHVFAFVRWKQTHPLMDWFGTSATVCSNMFESLYPCNFIPVQRISCRCAHALISVNFGHMVETVFIACPLPLRFCV